MEKVNKILKSSEYIEYLSEIKYYERDRIFCKHDLEHFLDVARIAYIMVLEEGIPVSKEIVYATAILHDIGRFMQYQDGTPHNQASHKLAKDLLIEAGFSEEDRNIILDAILNHRHKDENRFNDIFYKSDKLSRACYSCKATEQCYWSLEKRNNDIMY